jgi:hypothetical protein
VYCNHSLRKLWNTQKIFLVSLKFVLSHPSPRPHGLVYRLLERGVDDALVGDLDAQDWQSGTSVNRPSHISKHGNSRLRTALYMPALVAIKHNSACRLLNQRLELKHKPGKIRVVAVMRKLLHQILGS